MASRDAAGAGLSTYFAAIRGHRILSAERERTLAREVRDGSLEARNELIECNLAFVDRIASEYRGVGLSYEDLLNEGNVGLLEAAERFDPGRGVRFLTYAAWWIRKSILRAVAEHSNLVRLPETQVKVVREYRLEERRLRQQLGRRPRRDEVLDGMPAEPARVEALLRAAVRPVSLDQPLHDEGDASALGELLVDEASRPPIDSVERSQNAARVLAAVDRLPATRRRVIRLRFGLGGEPPMTLERIGRRLGVSRERIRQIVGVALTELRRSLARRRPERNASGAAGGGESMPRRRLRARLSRGDTRETPDRLHASCKDL